MKTKSSFLLMFTIVLSGIMLSCSKEDEYTYEDQPVSGDFTYATKSFIPIAIDSVTHQPLSASITLEGSATVTDMGLITMLSSFKFDFITGKGTDFVTTYTGQNVADSYNSTGSSQRQQDGSISVTESFNNGQGRFSKIKGGGVTNVILFPDGSGGTGKATWTVSY